MPDFTWVAKGFRSHILIGAFSKLPRICPGCGSGGLSLLMSGNWSFVLPLVARVWHATFQPADFTATSFFAASISAVVVAVAANAGASFMLPPPAPPERGASPPP